MMVIITTIDNDYDICVVDDSLAIEHSILDLTGERQFKQCSRHLSNESWKRSCCARDIYRTDRL